MRLFLAALLAIAMVGCERNEPESIYLPGGKFAQRLDARGRRFLVSGRDGEQLAKYRTRDEVLRVYGADMRPLGDLAVKDPIAVTHTNESPAAIERIDNAVVELKGKFRVESVEHGWAVYDGKSRRLGYFEWKGERLALRDDYSSAPRAYATAEPSAGARTPAGEVIVHVVPDAPSDVLLPFALETDALDALDKMALGYWLRQNRPRIGPNPSPAQAD